MPVRRRKFKEQQSDGGSDDDSASLDGSHSSEGHVSVEATAKTAQDLIGDKEEVWAVSGPTMIVKNLAIYRLILFGIIVHDYAAYLPHGLVGTRQDVGTWFTYDQFEFFYHWAPKTDDPFWGEEASRMLYWFGITTGTIAAFGGVPTMAYSFELCGFVTLALYAFRFLTFVQFFTNHNYLFLLLGFLVVISGGGSYRRPSNPKSIPRLTQKSEWGAIMIRIQYAVVYFYASVWKVTPNWLDGSICKLIFTTFQEQGVNRGVPWKELHQEYGDLLFQFVALGGLVLDTGMFCALTFRRPDPKTTKLFSRLSVMFHGFVCFTMSQRIGYTFPTCCLAGSLIFYPIGNDPTQAKEYAQSKKDDDHNDSQTNGAKEEASSYSEEGSLPQWFYRYAVGTKLARASRGQRLFALFWALLQIGMPLRMPIISEGTFPFTSRCYRWSWTMMLHSRSSYLIHTGTFSDGPRMGQQFALPFDMMNMYPECANVVPIQRHVYRRESIYKHADPRTLPLIVENSGIVQTRQRALMDQFPRHVARVAGGWSDLYYRLYPDACRNTATNERRRISVYGVYYTRLDGKGAFCRLFDPTVNLAEAEQARRRRTVWETAVGVLLDKAPDRYEYLLLRGIGSMNHKVDRYRKRLQKSYPEVKKIEFIADRAACLAARPLSIWPAGFPIAVTVMELPSHMQLHLSSRELPENTQPERRWEDLSEPEVTSLKLGQVEITSSTMLEFGVQVERSVSMGKCGDTEKEDVLIALMFLE